MLRNLLFLFWFVALQATAASIQGLPLLERYTSAHHGLLPSHLAVLSDARGRVYLGNAEGVLLFDGSHWNLVELPLQASARALALGADGRVYVGSYDHFGVLHEQPDGSFRYEDLRPRFGLNEEQRNLREVWDVLETPSGLYFHTSQRLFFLGYDGRTRHWPLTPDVRGFSVAGDALYVRVAGVGLCRFSDGELRPEPGAAVFAERPLYRLFPRAEGRLLVSGDGFYLADAAGVRQLPGEAAQVFAEDEPYTGIELADGSYALGTFGGRLLRFSSDLRLIGVYDVSAYTILALSMDREGGLWLATEGEALRLRMPSPWTRFGPDEGLRGGLYTAAWHEDALWVATSNGVLRAEASATAPRFELAIDTMLEASDLASTSAGLLVTDRNGLLWLPPGSRSPERLIDDEATFNVALSEHDDSLAFVIGDRHAHLLQREGGRWSPRWRWPLDGLVISSMHEVTPGELWIGNYRGWPQRWRLDFASGERRVEEIGPESGLALQAPNGASMLMLDEVVYAFSGQASFRWDGSAFVSDRPAPFDQIDRLMEAQVTTTEAGTFVHTSRELWLRRPDGSHWTPMHRTAGLGMGFGRVLGNADGRVRITTWSGLLQFDPGVAELPKPALQAGLRRAVVRDREGAVSRLALEGQSVPLLPARSNLQFDFGLVSMEGGPQYRYRIEGLVPHWSEYGEDDSVLVRELPAGEFRLELQARTRSGQEAAPFEYRFGVAPLWWETRWARGLFVLLALALLAGIVQVSSWLRLRNYAQQTRRLEQRIAERTAELQEANQRLAEMATIDSLTGVANRRALEHGLVREWQRCADTQRPIATLILDIDHFKQFNDRYGHLEGDERLRWVGSELRALHDPTRELLARFGGEEFVLVLPGHDLDAALARAEAIRRRFDGGDSPVTLSIGVAAVDPREQGDPQHALKAADEALYRAKRAGRNRVEAA
jgi:diguanylate cyclase (GGDEF)-like protein